MALFASLSERLNHIFSKLTKRGKLTELEIRTAMREVRIALLEADVNIKVAKQFIADVSEKAVGQEVLQSLNPAQQVIKIVNDELIALMGVLEDVFQKIGYELLILDFLTDRLLADLIDDVLGGAHGDIGGDEDLLQFVIECLADLVL